MNTECAVPEHAQVLGGVYWIRHLVAETEQALADPMVSRRDVIDRVLRVLRTRVREVEAQHQERSRSAAKRAAAATQLPAFVVARVRLAVDVAAKHYHIDPRGIMGSSRQRVVALPRHVAFWLARKAFPDLTLLQIALVFVRDHSTVMHGITKIDDRMYRDAEFRATVGTLRDTLEARAARERV
ncbi:MAG: hypothetical protein IPP14_15650 [Planctomycetes bacterium]|nr:hypothetical protein [Planctomycetota bacterium]